MYIHLTLIVLIPRLNLLVFGLPSENLFTSNDIDVSLVPEGSDSVNTIFKDPYSSSESIILNSNDLFPNEDFLVDSDTNIFREDEILETNIASQSPCVTQANELLSIVSRGGESCRAKDEPIPSPKVPQLFQDPIRLLNNLLLPKEKQQQPSGSSQPPDPDPIQPMYPGRLSDEEAAKKLVTPDAMRWNLEDMEGVERAPRDFSCDEQPFPVCCDGPVYWGPNWSTTDLANCDGGTLFS